jgi:DNA/RNA-binding domain of Phe-tRNA-synthetase-like protein
MVVSPLEDGWVARDLAEEFPDLSLRYLTVDARSGPSPAPVRRRLDELAGRITGGHVIHMRHDPVPWAYRVFWRQVGLDPDSDRTPVEQIAVDRLQHGGLPSRNVLDDAITLATLETGVALIAFDADHLDGRMGVRTSEAEEPLGGGGRELPGGQIVIADESRPLAVLGGEVAPSRGVTGDTSRMAIAAVAVKGVPEITVEEALWTVTGVVSPGGEPASGRW